MFYKQGKIQRKYLRATKEKSDVLSLSSSVLGDCGCEYSHVPLYAVMMVTGPKEYTLLLCPSLCRLICPLARSSSWKSILKKKSHLDPQICQVEEVVIYFLFWGSSRIPSASNRRRASSRAQVCILHRKSSLAVWQHMIQTCCDISFTAPSQT